MTVAVRDHSHYDPKNGSSEFYSPKTRRSETCTQFVGGGTRVLFYYPLETGTATATDAECFASNLFVRMKSSDAPKNWLSRINQIKAEIQNLPDRVDRPGIASPSPEAMKRIDLLIGALTGSKEPVFEVDPADGEIAILWSDTENRRSVSLNVDESDTVRIITFFAGEEVQPPVKRLRLRHKTDSVEIQQALNDPALRAIIQG